LIHEFTTKKLTSSKLQSDKASVEIMVDEILIVLGTSQANVSTSEDFEWGGDPARTYVSIEEERRQLKKKKKSEEEKKEEQNKHSKQLPEDIQTYPPEYYKSLIEMFMNLISVNVNKIHIRFEDDFFSHVEGPYAFGLTMSSLNINSTNKEIEFKSPLDMNYQEVFPEDDKNLFLKHILLNEICVYWNTNEKVYIPCKVIEKTQDRDQKIFDHMAIEPEEFRVLMLQPFKDVQQNMKKGDMSRMISDIPDFKYLITPFSIDINMSYYRLKDEDVKKHPYPRFQLTALMSAINVLIKPDFINDLKQFMEYFQYQMMLPYLKRFLPRRRPLTTHLYSRDPGINRVRRQIIKDWFCYVIWANRLKKVLSNDISYELFEEEIVVNKAKYDKALSRLRNPRDNELLDRHLLLDRGHDYNHLNQMVAPVIDEIYQRKQQEQAKIDMEFFKNFLQKFFIIIKVQSVSLEVYENSRSITYHGNQMPSIKLMLGRCRIGIKLDLQKLHFQVLLEDIKMFDTLQLKSRSRDGGATTINDTFAVKSGFFLDEDITDFFRRHEGDDSIFQNPNFASRFSAGDQTSNGIRLNERPRVHRYQDKGYEETFMEQRERDLAPDEIIQFGNHSMKRNTEKNDQSIFNFEGFWKKKIGKLIGMKTDDEEDQRTKSYGSKVTPFQSHYQSYQDDNGRNILER
jgi:hypothetical protein